MAYGYPIGPKLPLHLITDPEERRRRLKREQKKRYYKKHPEKKKRHKGRSRYGDPRFWLLRGARRRSKAGGIPFRLNLEDIVVPSHCPILDIPLARSPGGISSDNSPSLDRIIPELGYVKGNVAVISFKANSIKNNGTAEEHRKIADWIDSITKPRELRESA